VIKRRILVPWAIAAFAGTMSTGAARADVPLPTVGGTIFADFTNLDMENDGSKTSASGTGVDVTRFYLIFNEKFDDTWSANITTDATYNAGQQADVFIKKAYVQATLSKALWGRLGSADLPWVPLVERFYGYRFVEHVIVDRLHFGTSADWGLHGGGDLDDQRVSYAVSIVNGNGFKNPTRSKSMDVEARLAVTPLEGLTLAVGGYSGKLGKDEYGPTAPTIYHTANRFDALIAYVGGGLRLGGEYFSANDWNNVTTATSDKAEGTSVWASYQFTPLWSVFGRWDEAKTSQDLAPNRKDEYYNAGVAVHPHSKLQFALAYKHEKVDGGGLVNTAYGNLGGTLEGTVNEVGLWGVVSF
jgi:hypothetical protein